MPNWSPEELAAAGYVINPSDGKPRRIAPHAATRPTVAPPGADGGKVPLPFTITLPYPPQANNMYTVARGRKILSAKGREYKTEVAKRFERYANLAPFAGEVEVTLRVYRPRKAGDLDNTAKIVLDCLTGHVYADDKQITRIVADRYDDPKGPRVEIVVVERKP